MFFSFFFLFIFSVSVGANESFSKSKCCINKQIDDPQSFSLEQLNYDCGQLTTFGKKRCQDVWGGNICIWRNNVNCKPELKKCNRVPFYESHGNTVYDVGKCVGVCDGSKYGCEALSYEYIKTYFESDSLDELDGNTVRIIEECGCDNCMAVPKKDVIEVDVGACHGKCTEQQSRECVGGVMDNFNPTNNELSNPSTLLLSNYLNGCSAGVQTGFDVFTDNRCFGHTFIGCFQQGKCDVKSAKLDICMQAAQVPLTNTDGMMLGVNGVPLWVISLPVLNGGTWNPGETLCTTLDLSNLPNGGSNILGIVSATGHLDVGVQDDSAVDYLILSIEYEKCEQCLPTQISISSLYTENSVTHFGNIKDCECMNINKCHRNEYFETYFPGTPYETIVDKGQCVGKCPKMRCVADSSSGVIKGPYGETEITKIKSCECKPIIWNEFAE